MNWQLNLVVLSIALAFAYVARQSWRTWSRGCTGGCGCGKQSAKPQAASTRIIPVEELKLRVRPRS